MTVSQQNVAYPMKCSKCQHDWLALVEATMIEWSDDDYELHHGDLLECPECGHWNLIDME